MSIAGKLDRLWAIGRKSKVAYLRFYPNPGFMLPWFGGKKLKWSKHYGWTVKKER